MAWPTRPRWTRRARSAGLAAVACLLAEPGWAQRCHTLTAAQRAEVARVEEQLGEVDAPLPVRVSDLPTERTLLDVGGQPLYVMGRSTDPASRRLRSSLRRLAPQLDATLRRLGPRVDLRPAYFVPLTIPSETPDEARLSLAETRCYDEPGLLYGSSGEAQTVPGNACVIAAFTEEIASDDELDFALAHEFFHVLQHGSFPRADHTCRSAWWREGAANWFAHLVTGKDPRPSENAAFLAGVTTRSLTDFAYEAQVFHFWAGQRFGLPWVFELGQRPEARLATPAGASDIMGEDDWRAWAEAIADGTVTYPDGRPITGFPVAPSLHAIAPGEAVTLAGPGLSVHLAIVRASAGTHEVQYAPGGGLVGVGNDTPLPIRTDWTRIAPAGERRTDTRTCADASWRLAAIRTGGPRLDARLAFTSSDAQPCDACYYGTWEEVVDRMQDDVSIDAAGRPVDLMRNRLVGEHALQSTLADGTVIRRAWRARPVLTVASDGTYTLDDPRTTTTTAPDGQPLVTSRDDVHREVGTWSPVEGGRVAVQRQRREISGSQAMLTMGAVPYREDRRLRGRPIQYVVACSATRMELWLPPIWALRAVQAREATPPDEPARPARVFVKPTTPR